MSNLIQTQISNSVLTITINRPLQKNALSLQMYQDMTNTLLELENNDEIKAAIFYGSTECFTAGNDLKDFLAAGELNKQHPTIQFLHQLAVTRKPLLAAVAGPAIGIGTTLLLHCDLVYAAPNAVFQLPFAQLGLCPEAGSSLLLPKLVGHQKAFELLVLGDKFDANQALSLGLVNQLVDPQALYDKASHAAHRLAKLPTDAVLTTKDLIKGQQSAITEQIDEEIKHFNRLLNSDASQSIIQSFFKK